jgi:hypothetical protein
MDVAFAWGREKTRGRELGVCSELTPALAVDQEHARRIVIMGEFGGAQINLRRLRWLRWLPHSVHVQVSLGLITGQRGARCWCRRMNASMTMRARNEVVERRKGHAASKINISARR